MNADELTSLVCEIENRLNNRPLTYVENEVDGLETLTPSHLLHGRVLNSIPTIVNKISEIDPDSIDSEIINKSLTVLNKSINKFQNLWSKHYLTSLREFHASKKSPRRGNNELNLCVGDIVLIHDERPRSLWKLGKINELLPGKDGNIRVVRLNTRYGETIRSINKLYPLEMAPPISDYTVDTQARPKRLSAIKSGELTKTFIHSGYV